MNRFSTLSVHLLLMAGLASGGSVAMAQSAPDATNPNAPVRFAGVTPASTVPVQPTLMPEGYFVGPVDFLIPSGLTVPQRDDLWSHLLVAHQAWVLNRLSSQSKANAPSAFHLDPDLMKKLADSTPLNETLTFPIPKFGSDADRMSLVTALNNEYVTWLKNYFQNSKPNPVSVVHVPTSPAVPAHTVAKTPPRKAPQSVPRQPASAPVGGQQGQSIPDAPQAAVPTGSGEAESQDVPLPVPPPAPPPPLPPRPPLPSSSTTRVAPPASDVTGAPPSPADVAAPEAQAVPEPAVPPPLPPQNSPNQVSGPATSPPPPTARQAAVDAAQIGHQVQNGVIPPAMDCGPVSPGNAPSTGGDGLRPPTALPGILTPGDAVRRALCGGTLQRLGGPVQLTADNNFKSCVYRNGQVTVVYDNCDPGATNESGVTIYAPNGQSARFHVTAASVNGRNSPTGVADSQYAQGGYPLNWEWYVELREQTGPTPNPARDGLSQVVANEANPDGHKLSCSVDRDGPYNHSADCAGNQAMSPWLGSAVNFSARPPSDWFQLLKALQAGGRQLSNQSQCSGAM